MHPAAVLELDGAEREGLVDGGEEPAHCTARHRPDLEFDRGAAGLRTHERRALAVRQGEEAIAGRRAGGGDAPGAAAGEFPVERLTGHVGAADRQVECAGQRFVGAGRLFAEERRGRVQQGVVASGRREQGHPERQALGRRPGRDRHRTEVEQVDAVGERAQTRVRPKRVRLHFGERVVRRSGGRDEHVDVGEGPVRCPPQLGEPVPRPEAVRRVQCPASLDHRPRYRVHGVRVRHHEVTYRRDPLREPRPLVEQPAGGEERLRVDG